jgi:hypothetical protein
MTEPTQFRVTVKLRGKHPTHTDYPLLPGDILTRDHKGFMKHAPGLAIGGFILGEDDFATLEPADEARWVIADGWDDFLG